MLTTSTTSKLVIACAILVLLSSCVSKKNFNALTAEKEALSKKMDMMQKDFDAKIADLEAGKQDLMDQNTKLDGSITDLNGKLETTNAKVTAVEGDLSASNAKISAIQSELSSSFADINVAMSTNDQRIKEVENMLYLDLDNPFIYNSGSNNLSKADIEVLDSLASVLKSKPNLSMIVEGHTDKRTISNEEHSDNWDLSVSRSTNVVRKLI